MVKESVAHPVGVKRTDTEELATCSVQAPEK